MCGCHGDEWCWRRRGSVAFLPLVSLWSSSLHPHSGGTSVSVVSKEAAAADKQLLCSLMASLWRQHDCGAKWQTSLRLSSYRSLPLVFVERFIPSHASKNTHSNTHTHSKTTSRWQSNFGSRGLSIMPKAPARMWSKEEDIRDSWYYLSRKTMQMLVLSNFTQSYYMHAQTHTERLKRSAPDAHSHRRHTCTSMLSGEMKTRPWSRNQKQKKYAEWRA